MKIAKASERDIEMALKLANWLESIENGRMPDDLTEGEETEWINTDDTEQYQILICGIRRLLNQFSIFRVVFGMSVVCDPANKLLDPDASSIEHHPERQNAEAALLWVLYHHQGGSSNIGQPIRKLLGIGQFDRLTDEEIANAKAFYEASDSADKQTRTYRYAGSFGGVA